MSEQPGDAVLAELRPTLVAQRQEHLLAFWDELSHEQRTSLSEEIRSLDLPLVQRLLHERHGKQDWQALAARAKPAPAFRLDERHNAFSHAQAVERGREAIAAGKLGMVLVAGGQGTRLGFDHPKGTYPIGPVSGATLFQILIEKLRAVAARDGARIPLYLMTSPATHEETVAFLEAHHRFGLAADDLAIFCQGTMPAVDAASGRILLEEKHHLALSPDGHGGTLAALRRSGCLADAQRRGIEQLFYAQVDNPLVSVCDPALIGYHLLSGSEMSTQVVAKTDPLQRVGLVVEIDGRAQIIEYSDLPEDVARRQAADGSLELWAGNIAVHVLDVAFLDRMSMGQGRLPFHIAKKKVPYIDEQGRRVEPAEPNALKFERFIFDLLPEASNAIVVEVDEATDFAAVKNAPGAGRESPEWVQERMIALHTRWLREAGGEVPDGTPVEISPLCALDGEQLKKRVECGMRISGPTYLE